ncbi:MAG: hypothetical protein ACYC0Y_19340 [Pirellulales bacterium]
MRTLDRHEYSSPHLDPNGQPITAVVRRRVRCANPACGQVSVEVTYEFRP